jgi:tetratricopeptide (TPR) repeat protein
LHHYREAVRWKPDYVIAVYNVGNVSERLGDMDTAQASYRHALALKPDLILALDRLARLLSSGKGSLKQDPQEAIQLAEKANRLTAYKDPYLLETLGMAYAADGRLGDAGKRLQQAVNAASRSGNNRLAGQLNHRLETIRN